ncbi:hypothetical protein [Cryobacterium sp. GrIS_2_6]|uniref:hypothetical protein n=1 Tax=Cryobacterium sp. GrIS_2_6 TaxID=3162785 RepID=UPI002E03E594|nr:hypothetical protein [Cryobacterium psychrotolerans]
MRSVIVALPGRVTGLSAPGAVRWINPEHVVSVRPRLAVTLEGLDLFVELKLEGLPLFETWIGTFENKELADSRRQSYLAELAAS